MKDLLAYIARNLVEHPDAVNVTEVQREQAERERYEAAMNAGRDIIATVTDAESARVGMSWMRMVRRYSFSAV